MASRCQGERTHTLIRVVHSVDFAAGAVRLGKIALGVEIDRFKFNERL